MNFFKRVWRFFRIPSQRTALYYSGEFERLKRDAAQKGFVMRHDITCRHGQYLLTRCEVEWYFHRLMDLKHFLDYSEAGPVMEQFSDEADNIIKIQFRQQPQP